MLMLMLMLMVMLMLMLMLIGKIPVTESLSPALTMARVNFHTESEALMGFGAFNRKNSSREIPIRYKSLATGAQDLAPVRRWRWLRLLKTWPKRVPHGQTLGFTSAEPSKVLSLKAPYFFYRRTWPPTLSSWPSSSSPPWWGQGQSEEVVMLALELLSNNPWKWLLAVIFQHLHHSLHCQSQPQI